MCIRDRSHRWSDKQAASSQKQVVYRVKNWAVYNESLVQRGSLTVWLSQEAIDGWRYAGPSQRGAQFLYSDQAIETALTLRKLFGLALRQTEGFVQSLLSMLDLDLSAPNYSTLSRRHPGLQVDLPVKPTHKPRHLVADSTGLKLYGEGEWQVRQQGWTQRRTWRKRHLGFDAHTGEVVAQTLTAAGFTAMARMIGRKSIGCWLIPPSPGRRRLKRSSRRSAMRLSVSPSDAIDILKRATSGCSPSCTWDGNDGNGTEGIINGAWLRPAWLATSAFWGRSWPPEPGKGSKPKCGSDVAYSIG